MLTLAEYKDELALAAPFLVQEPLPAPSQLPSLVQELLARLAEKDGWPAHVSAGLTPRQTLYAALISRPARPLAVGFMNQLDLLLAREAAARTTVSAAALAKVAQWSGRTDHAAQSCAVWEGDIITLKVDAIVNAANSALLGCFRPFHACIDNCIHAACGPRLRADCQLLMQRQGAPEPTGCSKLTRAYHLPARFILHTVGPIHAGDSSAISPEQSRLLAACYWSCLDTAAAFPGIRSLAFPCISTGVFGFPAKPAAAIAIRTVEQWLEAHPGQLDLVVFNVFSTQDGEIYRSLLKRRLS